MLFPAYRVSSVNVSPRVINRFYGNCKIKNRSLSSSVGMGHLSIIKMDIFPRFDCNIEEMLYWLHFFKFYAFHWSQIWSIKNVLNSRIKLVFGVNHLQPPFQASYREKDTDDIQRQINKTIKEANSEILSQVSRFWTVICLQWSNKFTKTRKWFGEARS